MHVRSTTSSSSSPPPSTPSDSEPPKHTTYVETSQFVDTLDMAQQYQKAGLTSAQAEHITRLVTRILLLQRQYFDEKYLKLADSEKVQLQQGVRLDTFKADMSKTLDLKVSTMQKDVERLAGQVTNIRQELRYETEKLTASQRLDLSLEKGRMRDELLGIRDKIQEIEVKLDKEINGMKASVEQGKNDILKWILGIIFTIILAGLGLARMLSSGPAPPRKDKLYL